MNRTVSVIVLVVLVVVGTMSPSVLASETRTVHGSITLTNGHGHDADFTWNISDPNNTYLFNWNQTVEGFQNDTGLNGTFTGPFLPPGEVMIVENLNDIDTLTICGQTRFQSSWIMSGSSESYWRVPERGPGYGGIVNLTIWRIDSPGILNFTNAWEPNSASHPILVFNYSYELTNTELNDTYRFYNTTTSWDNHTFNSTWVRVAAPIHGDDSYAFRWEVTNRSTYYEHWVRLAQNDIGGDRIYTTWLFYPNGTRYFLNADLDVSVLHVFGMGHSVWGDTAENVVDDPVIQWDVQLRDPIDEGDNLTVMVPFVSPVTNDSQVRISVATFNGSWSAWFYASEDGPTDFGLKSWTWDAGWPAQNFTITLTIMNTTRTLWIYDPNTEGDPDFPYLFSRYNYTSHDWAPAGYNFGGIPYGILQVTNGSWENTQPVHEFYLGGRQVDPDSVYNKAWGRSRSSQHSDDWILDMLVTGYEGIARVTAAISFSFDGQFGRAWDALDFDTPFPTDAPWYFGKYYLQFVMAVKDFLGDLGDKFWSAMAWIYEGIVWLVENAGWVLAGAFKILTLFIAIPIWGRFFLVIGALIKFGWIMAQDGLIKSAEFASEFWSNYIATSYAKKFVSRVPIPGVK